MQVERMASGLRFTDQDLPDGRRELRVIYSNAPLAVRDALRTVMSGLDELRLTLDERSNIEIVLAEILNNVSEHAYAEDPDGQVQVRIVKTRERLSCSVSDTGPPMPPGLIDAVENPALAEDATELPEGGFGWFLIHTLAKNVSYRRAPGTNELCFEMEIGASVAAN